ncbi:MAG: bifunctional phosphopantothenoylcysteine decarboxylase/phosphopantothenate--cysteine ligase CoaBC [Thermoleophilia bacterium]
MQYSGKSITLGVTGSIAAYKAVELLRLLKSDGHDVHVVQTPSGARFVGEATFRALSGHAVAGDAFAGESADGIAHIELARSDLLIIAPATANTIGKMAAGIADNLLLSSYLAMDGPVFVAPAMNRRMWHHAAVQENMATLERRGVHNIMPKTGNLACGETGDGRMEEPEQILARVRDLFTSSQSADLEGVDILVTAGATRELIDSIRFITNRSSGRMGFALAKASRERGASVTVIAANCALERHPGIRYIDVQTSAELQNVLEHEFDKCNVLLMAAAVADYKVSTTTATGKLERKSDIHLQLVPTSDIVSNLRGNGNERLKVGFAAEFGSDKIERARRKLEEKNLGMIVFNDISRPDIGFESEENEITILMPGRNDEFVEKATKLECAHRILDKVRESIRQ